MSGHSAEDLVAAGTQPLAIPVTVADGSRFELPCVQPAGGWRGLLYWLPAMGISARCYLLLAGGLGYLPGRRIGFGGNEARGVIADWSRTGRTSRYAAAGTTQDFERQLASRGLPLLALRLRDDWLAPQASLDWLLGKLGPGERSMDVITPQELTGPADHFGWMKTPGPVAARIARWLAGQDAAAIRHLGTVACFHGHPPASGWAVPAGIHDESV